MQEQTPWLLPPTNIPPNNKLDKESNTYVIKNCVPQQDGINI